MFVPRVWNTSQWFLALKWLFTGGNSLEQWIEWETGTGQNPVEDPIWSPPGHTDAQRKRLSASQHLCSALKESSSVGSALLVFPFYRKEIKAQRTYLAGKKMGQNLKWAWVQNSHSWRPHQMTSTQPLSSLFHVASLLPLCTHCIYSKGRGGV